MPLLGVAVYIDNGDFAGLQSRHLLTNYMKLSGSCIICPLHGIEDVGDSYSETICVIERCVYTLNRQVPPRKFQLRT
jgi:hypothetical protein